MNSVFLPSTKQALDSLPLPPHQLNTVRIHDFIYCSDALFHLLFTAETILFTKDLTDLKVTNLEETVELVCELSKDGLKVEWFKNDKAIRRHDKSNYVAEGTVHKLIIEKPSQEDIGEYKAVYEKLETSCKLDIAGEYHAIY